MVGPVHSTAKMLPPGSAPNMAEATLSRSPTMIIGPTGRGGKPTAEPSAVCDDGVSLVAKLDSDSIMHIAHFLGVSNVLTLCAACHEWARVFSGCVPRLRLSLVSLSLGQMPGSEVP